MPDKREQILVRCRQVIEAVPGLASSGGQVRGVGRNRDDITGKARPAIIVHDGGEEVVEMSSMPRRSGVQLVKMQPQFVILIGSETEQIGTLANQFRAALINAIFTDDTLIGLAGGPFGNGDIRYEGCELETQAGTTREARLTVNISFTYAFRTSDLAA